MGKKNYALTIKEKFIISLIGIEYDLMKESGNDNMLKFYFSGVIVVVIMAISFVSVFYGFELMFNMWYAELLLSLFFSFMFSNIYIFLIQTFSKEVFPTSYKIKFFNLSNLSRIGFVLLIGFLIAQPFKILIFKDKLENDIPKYKIKLSHYFDIKNRSLYQTDIIKLEQQKKTYQTIGKSTLLIDEINQIDKKLLEINKQINTANIIAFDKINRSEFFIKRIEVAQQYPLSYIIDIVVLAIFCLPLFLIYSISGNSLYFKLKKQRDRNLVIEEYKRFKKKYTNLFSSKYGLPSVQFYEPFLDPPFNTRRKIKPVFLSQDEFLNKRFKDDRL